jgi:hypothetical protein
MVWARTMGTAGGSDAFPIGEGFRKLYGKIDKDIPASDSSDSKSGLTFEIANSTFPHLTPRLQPGPFQREEIHRSNDPQRARGQEQHPDDRLHDREPHVVLDCGGVLL